MISTKRCMNGGCGARSAADEWRRGWPLRLGGFAALCDKCGKAYEQSVFCDLFHQNESGWRECLCCGKHLHCGCIASKALVELVDGGGVQCINCTMNSGPSFISSETTQALVPQPSQRVLPLTARSLKDERVNDDFNVLLAGSSCELQQLTTSCRIDEDAICKGKAIQSGESIEVTGQNMFLPHMESLDGSFDHIKREQMTHLTRQALSISLGNSNQSTFMEPILNAVKDGRDQHKMTSAIQKAQRAGHLLPKPPQKGQVIASEASKEIVSKMYVARPPAEGRGRNQLLPRYWPRITDQELRQISGDSNSTIVPLFEKVLSASDAGRIGRLVLPKACAEAYFPPISQAEGLPLKIQDVKGKEWHFQFRFWPNNNSRMYVLEGVTPCIQSLQLQAGDTVTFSRMDPEGKLIMGFRKATNSVPLQDSQITAIANAGLGNETFFSGINGSLSIASGYPGFFQSLKEAADPHLSYLSENLNSTDDARWQKTDKHGGRLNEGFLMQPTLVQENKRSRNIGGRNKRLHMDNEEALELKLSWEEAQDLLRPPPSGKPSFVMIEDQEFEEYEVKEKFGQDTKGGHHNFYIGYGRCLEPPVFGKRTIFTARSCGDQDQWVQCDDCFKWRRLPVDVLVPSKWTCADNTWDPKRSSCSAPDKLSSTEIHNLLQQNAEIRRQRASTSSNRNPEEVEVSDLDALVTAAALGDSTHQATTLSSATTTKHPRHRPGCTCIVCIQPPSGKGPKHHPNCMCNVCVTVKRRFKTLMMRRKKRQSEREEAEANKRLEVNEVGTELDIVDNVDMGKGHIDLNFQPKQNETRVGMTSLVHVASLPLESYLKQNGLARLACEQQANSSSAMVPRARPIDDSEEEGSSDNVKSDAF